MADSEFENRQRILTEVEELRKTLDAVVARLQHMETLLRAERAPVKPDVRAQAEEKAAKFIWGASTPIPPASVVPPLPLQPAPALAPELPAVPKAPEPPPFAETAAAPPEPPTEIPDVAAAESDMQTAAPAAMDMPAEPVKPPEIAPPAAPVPAWAAEPDSSPDFDEVQTPEQPRFKSLFDVPSEAPKPKINWEDRIARYYMPRVGAACFVVALVWAASQFSFGPYGKICLGYVLAACMMGVGLWQRRKVPVWSMPMIGCGLAIGYFTTFAMGHVKAMQIVHSTTLKLGLLFSYVGFMLFTAHKLKSEVIGGMSILLGYLTTGVAGNDQTSGVSLIALSVAAIGFQWLNGWLVTGTMSVIAVYAAHTYAWKFLPPEEPRTALSNFWHHGLFLTAYFLTFSLGGIGARKTLLAAASHTTSDGAKGLVSEPALPQLFASAMWTNIVLYVGGMVYLHRATEIYWDHAWVFFFGFATYLLLTSLLYSALPGIRFSKHLGAAVCISFGIMSLCSPAWLPVMLALQAIGNLYACRRQGKVAWAHLSLAVLLYAGAHVLTKGRIDVLGFGTRLPDMLVSAWTVYATLLVILAYVVLWDWWVNPAIPEAPTLHYDKIAAVFGVLLFFWGLGHYVEPPLIARRSLQVVGIVALLAVWMRVPVLLWFVTPAAVVGGYLLLGIVLRNSSVVEPLPLAIWSLLPLYAATQLERRGTDNPGWDITAAHLLLALFQTAFAIWAFRFASASGFPLMMSALMLGIVIVGAGMQCRWTLRSAIVPPALCAIVTLYQLAEKAPNMMSSSNVPDIASPSFFAAALIFAAAAFLLGSFPVLERTGAQRSARYSFSEAIIIAGAGGLTLLWISSDAREFISLSTAMTGFVIAVVGAIAGRYHVIVCGLLYTLLAAVFLAGKADRLDASGAAVHFPMWINLAAVACLVAAERVVAWSDRLLKVDDPRRGPVPSDVAALVTKIGAVGSLIVLLILLPGYPEIRKLHLTVTIVISSFVWIAMGFMFQSGAYRKSGFVVLCLGALKAMTFDVFALQKKYRIILWLVLSGLMFCASFMYSRFRDRLGIGFSAKPDEPEELPREEA